MKCPVCKSKFSLSDKMNILKTKDCSITCTKCKKTFVVDLKWIAMISAALGIFISSLITHNMEYNIVTFILAIVIIFALVLILLDFKKLK